MAADCPFCNRIAAREYESFDDDPDVVWFEPLNPVTPGHLLFAPVLHLGDALESPYDTAITMEAASRRAAELRAMALPGAWDCNLITSAGPAATQSVGHLHVHLVPRTAGDGLLLPWTGQEAAARLAELENAVNWSPSCRREKAEVRLAAIRAYAEDPATHEPARDVLRALLGELPELRYSGTPITEPGTYRIQSWGRKTYYWDSGYEYDGGVAVMDPAEVH